MIRCGRGSRLPPLCCDRGLCQLLGPISVADILLAVTALVALMLLCRRLTRAKVIDIYIWMLQLLPFAAVASTALLLLVCIVSKVTKLFHVEDLAGIMWPECFIEDVTANLSWLAFVAMWTYLVAPCAVARAFAAIGAVCINGINLIVISIVIADCIYFLQMGENLNLQTLQLVVVGSNGRAMFTAVKTQVPFLLPLALGVLVMYSSLLLFIATRWQRVHRRRRRSHVAINCLPHASTMTVPTRKSSVTRLYLMYFCLLSGLTAVCWCTAAARNARSHEIKYLHMCMHTCAYTCI